MNLFSSLINTCFLLGKSSFAPGTIGSLFALIVWFLFSPAVGNSGFLIIVLITALSYWTILFELSNTSEKDPQYIVIDEAIGMWLSLLFISPNDFINIGLAFTMFRLLDILKPSIIARVQNVEGAAGVLIDDIVCGIITSIIIIGVVSL